MAIREGRWDCQYCGNIGNLGRHRNCQNCGHSRPEGTKFYLADDSEVTDKKLQRQALVGPDWICEYCGTSNAADIAVCGSCGAARDETSPVQQVKEYEPDQVPTTGDMTFDEEPEPAKSPPEKTTDKKKLPIAIIAGIGAIALLCLAVIAFLVFGGRDAEASVTGFQWERTVEVEAFQTVVEEDWEIPSGGRLISQREEIHHYDQILDHYETRQRQVEERVQVGVETYVCGQRDLGTGFFEDIECERPVYETQVRTETYEEPIYRDEPVYRPLYTYKIDKWIVVRTEESSGNDHSPYWPRADLGSDEREGETTEVYVVYFVDEDGDTVEWETTLEEWQALEQGQNVVLNLNALGQISEIERP